MPNGNVCGIAAIAEIPFMMPKSYGFKTRIRRVAWKSDLLEAGMFPNTQINLHISNQGA